MNRARRTTAAAATALVLATAGGLIAVTAAPASAAGCVPPAYTRQIFANTTFSGTPKQTGCDAVISENWGTGAPATGVPSNYFGVRWAVTRDFGSGGPFTFTAAARDGIRVYLDGVRKVDVWKNVSTTVTKTVNLSIPSGKHTLRIDYVNWTGSADVKFAYTPRTSATVDTVAPLAPKGVWTSYDTVGLKAYVRWAKNHEMDLAGYHVYRRLAGSTSWSRVNSTLLTGTALTDAPPPTGQGYSYEVRAVDKAGRVSPGSADVSVTTVDRTGPAAPTGLTVTGDCYGNRLAWNPVAGAAGYRVEYSPQASGPFTLLQFTTDPRHRDLDAPCNAPRYYRVLALDPLDNPSAPSAVVLGDGVDRTPPEAPFDVEAWAEASDVDVYWKVSPSTQADLSQEGTLRVYRSAGTTVAPDAQPLDCDIRYHGSTSSSPWYEAICPSTDDWAPDSVYAYAVTAVDQFGNESPRSTVIARNEDAVPPAPVTGLKATPRRDGVLVEWNAGPEPDVSTYDVFYGVMKDGEPEWLGPCNNGSIWNTAQLCVNLPDGEDYVFTAVADDRWGNQLPLTDPSVPHVAATELDVRPPVTAPEGSPISVISGWTQYTWMPMYWKCAPGADCSQVTGYHVDRWDPAQGAYVRLTQAPLPAGADRYEDPGAKLGDTYFYRVTPVLADGSEGVPATGWRLYAATV
ncbi:fibronectin type III domain-containing protein [Streptomyces sp. NPDC051315]|uniref:fibronectin type III domain-containing protein n=1 Tax=Streptomyces sp. NPDC051315 TaxID=3365650 RepID=UPI0037AF28A5